jgi:hypothetical protein
MNTGALVFIIIAVLLFLMVVAVGRYARHFVQQDPVRIAAGDAYQRALTYAKAHRDDREASKRVFLLGRISLYGDTGEDDDISARLKQLDQLHENGEITDAIHLERYREILDELASSSPPPLSESGTQRRPEPCATP